MFNSIQTKRRDCPRLYPSRSSVNNSTLKNMVIINIPLELKTKKKMHNVITLS